MENHISLRPHPSTLSYLRHFQVAQRNLNLFIQEQRLSKRKRRNRNMLKTDD
ncbi:MAG TPA: hypothetical protein VGD65_26450 [Chryseosolibacter sp.]